MLVSPDEQIKWTRKKLRRALKKYLDNNNCIINDIEFYDVIVKNDEDKKTTKINSRSGKTRRPFLRRGWYYQVPIVRCRRTREFRNKGWIVFKSGVKVRVYGPSGLKINIKDPLSCALNTASIHEFTKPLGERTAIAATIAYLLLVVYNNIAININDEEIIRVILECHNRNAYVYGIDEDELIRVTNSSIETMNYLNEIGCITIEDGKVYLEEKVLI